MVLFLASAIANAATSHAIPAPPGSGNTSPTYTLLWEVEDPQFTLVVVLGGEGRVGFNANTTDSRHPTAQMLQLITGKSAVPLRMNIAVFDSPVPLSLRMRSDSEHLDRIESAVRFYRDRFKVPVWLMGHSNGAFSASEYLAKKQAVMPVVGVVLSGSVYQINVKEGLDIPMLFLHHEEDGCKDTPPSYARRNFERVKGYNKALTEFMLVKGGQEQGDPCRNGKHMYFGARDEAAGLLADFLGRATR